MFLLEPNLVHRTSTQVLHLIFCVLCYLPIKKIVMFLLRFERSTFNLEKNQQAMNLTTCQRDFVIELHVWVGATNEYRSMCVLVTHGPK